eukprot:TRINITY_DN7133_c0_g1_i1.p1 TRINITY_DN7133_c0_g1~~TRINITY_DN7133_c0_g1_i1.p1  ORF type:complete len:375 (-),score=54.88 TRINITY_DN7133_c0_g1_i1:133-1257(-)
MNANIVKISKPIIFCCFVAVVVIVIYSFNDCKMPYMQYEVEQNTDSSPDNSHPEPSPTPLPTKRPKPMSALEASSLSRIEQFLRSLDPYSLEYEVRDDSIADMTFVKKKLPDVGRPLLKPHFYQNSGGHMGWINGAEQHVQQLFQKVAYGVEDCLVFDIGANDGQYTVLSAVSGCYVVAFEPQPTCYDPIALSVRMNGVDERVRIINRAAHHKNLTVDISFPDTCHGQFKLQKRGVEVVRPTSTIIIDDIVPENIQITLLKLDTEGHEPEALKGALKLFKNHQIENAVVEIFPFYWTNEGKQIGYGVFEDIFKSGYAIQCLGRYDYNLDSTTAIGPMPLFTIQNYTEFTYFLGNETVYGNGKVCVDWHFFPVSE